jgi:putative peptidoglycan lipid II flippase
MTAQPDNFRRESGTGSSRALSGHEIARAAALVLIGFVFSRILGVVREAVVSGVFGLGSDYDAYAAALQVPDTIFFVIAGGAIGSAFIPTFAAHLARGSKEDAWLMASSVINLFLVVMVLISGLAMLLARPITVLTVARGFTPAVQDLTIRLMRIMLVSSVIFGISGIQMGILNAHQRFLLPALAPSLYNVGIIIGAVVLAPGLGLGIAGVAWGVVLGAALHLLIQLPGLFGLGGIYSFHFDFRHAGVREVGRLMAPRVLGQAIVQVNFWVNKSLASEMLPGAVGAINRAWYLMMLPQGLIAQSVATAVFPTFAAQVADGDSQALRRTLGQVLRGVLFLSVPATVGLIMLRLPIVRLVYEHGVATREESEAVAWALLFFALGLIAHSLVEIITRAFYALHDTRTPVLVGGMAMAINLVLSFTLVRFIGTPGSLERGPFAGLALANTLATALEGCALLLLIGRRVRGLEIGRLAASSGRAAAASLVMGISLWLLERPVGQLGQIVGPVVAVTLGGAIFWLAAFLLGSEEVRLFTRLALSRLRTARPVR